EDTTHFVMFGLDYPIQDSSQPPMFTLANAQLPWNGGTIRLAQVVTEMNNTQPIAIPVQVDQVSLNALLQQAVGADASATGTVSGQIPLVISRNGAIT